MIQMQMLSPKLSQINFATRNYLKRGRIKTDRKLGRNPLHVIVLQDYQGYL